MTIKTQFSDKMHQMKYRQPGESFESAMHRIARTLSDNSQHQREFEDALLNLRFLPAGRVQAGCGTPKSVTLFNCYVSGTIQDSFTGPGGIMQRATEAAETMRMGGGIGYDFSPLRPRGDLIKSLDSNASGPVSFMEIFDSVCKTVSSAGHRRGAQMGILRCDHPDIEEFIFSKQTPGKLTNFNISIGITDEFMKAVKTGSSFDLRFNGKVYKTVDAARLWDEIMQSTWDWAEPGVIFLDTVNRDNNLWYCETIAATNPCSEQVLPPFGACLLGSFNLTKYVKKGEFDYDQFRKDIISCVRAMDNINDVSIYPLVAQKDEALSKRRMGLGITGYANAVEIMGYSYGSKKALQYLNSILAVLANVSYITSCKLAIEKGSFPLFDKEKYVESEYLKKAIRKEVREAIYKHGIRNSHLTSIAPTGTISLCADNVSSGIEPVFSYNGLRTIQTFEGPFTADITDYAYREHNVRGKKASECSADDHVNTLLASQRWIDSAVSKTCNVDGSMPWEDFKNIYMKAYEGGAKGCTTFNADGKRMGILVDKEAAKKDEDGQACFIDPETGKKTCE